MERWLTTYTALAAYLGLTADGIRRIMKNEELLLHLVRCNAQEAGADWRKECAKYKARLRHPAGRGFVDARMFFRAFAPDLVDDAEELRRAVAGQPTWMKAADAENALSENRSQRFRAGWPELHTSQANFVVAARGDRKPLAAARPVDAGGTGNLAEIREPGFQWAANGRICGGGRFRFRNGMGCWRFGRRRRVWGRAGAGSASSESRWRFSPKSFTEAPVPG